MKTYRHGEAFSLMWYRCEACGHQERIWNSRDGVTPFCMACPSCGGMTLQHHNWSADERAPDHKTRRGQRFWRDGTKEEARGILERRFERFAAQGQAVPEDVKAAMLADLDKPSVERQEFQDGWPTLDIQLPV